MSFYWHPILNFIDFSALVWQSALYEPKAQNGPYSLQPMEVEI